MTGYKFTICRHIRTKNVFDKITKQWDKISFKCNNKIFHCPANLYFPKNKTGGYTDYVVCPYCNTVHPVERLVGVQV